MVSSASMTSILCIFVDANPKKRRRQIANDYLLLLQVEPIVQRAAQRIDMGLRYAQNAWIEGTKENGTILQIMKDFDNAALAFRNGSINVLKSMSSSMASLRAVLPTLLI